MCSAYDVYKIVCNVCIESPGLYAMNRQNHQTELIPLWTRVFQLQLRITNWLVNPYKSHSFSYVRIIIMSCQVFWVDGKKAIQDPYKKCQDNSNRTPARIRFQSFEK